MTDQPVAIVTAAGQGMGAACARELADRGYRLAVLSPSGAAALTQELQDAGKQVLALAGSVTETKDLESLVDQVMSAWGRIDGVVANTGHPPKGPLLEISDQDWHSALDLVVLNVVRLTRLITPIMQQQGSGAWVNISTFSAFEPKLDFPISSCLRAALGSFAKLYSDRYAGDGIRMNNLLPGYIDSYPESAEIVAKIPLGRFGKVEEIGRTAAFLLSSDAGYLTGQNLRVDGGISHGV